MAFQQQPQGISAASRPADYLQQYMNFGIAVTDSMKNDAAQLAAMGRQKWADETTQLKQLWTDKFNRTQTEEYMKAITEMLDKQQKLDEERLKNNEQNADNMKFKEEMLNAFNSVIDKINKGDEDKNRQAYQIIVPSSFIGPKEAFDTGNKWENAYKGAFGYDTISPNDEETEMKRFAEQYPIYKLVPEKLKDAYYQDKIRRELATHAFKSYNEKLAKEAKDKKIAQYEITY